METTLIQSLASCRSFRELAQAVVGANLYNHDFTACLIAEIGEDGRIREVGRFGIAGPGPSAESVPLWDRGLIAQALKGQTPTLLDNPFEAAQRSELTPSSDIDHLVVENGFQGVMVVPLRHAGLLKGVIGLCSVTKPSQQLVSQYNYLDFQALMTLATRSVAYGIAPAKHETEALILTVRDRAVLSLIIRGLTNKEISKELQLSLPTVKLAVSSLIAKLGANSRHAASERARALGLI